MGVQEDLRIYINKHKSEKGKSYTNTSIGNPKVSLYIKDDEYKEFLDLYALAIINGISLHFTEKPLDPSPLRIDLDFRFGLGEEKKIERKYDDKTIYNIINKYFEIINKYLELSNDENIAYIMEKPIPSEYRNKIKDGIHIVFPHIIATNNTHHFIRKKILDIANDIFKDLPLCNEYEDVIDKAIINANCWQMYGSKKPDCETYRVSKIYKYTNEKTELIKYTATVNDEINYITLFSMRKTCMASKIKDEYKNELDEYIKHVLPSTDKNKKDKLENNILFNKAININKNYTNEDELELARALVMECLSHTRADKYDDWITLGWVLRNIDYRLLNTWVEFSQIGSSYVEGECQRLWDKMRKDHMGMGTLRWWAKIDNITRYNEIIDETIFSLIDIAISSDGAHYDIAKVIQAQYKDEYKAVSKDLWYKYDKRKHRWAKTREGLYLRRALSDDICRKFIERAKHYNHLLINAYNEDGSKTVNDEKAKKAQKIALQLKNASFKDHVMKECKCLFIDEKFEEILDSRKHLIGFDNGVYDLKMHIFRDGMPDDYISHSTNKDYIPYNPLLQEIEEINNFFSKLFTNESIKNYVLDILCCIIDGSIIQERFYIFTGEGSNGKSKLLDLIQKTVGDYYSTLPISLLTQKRAASNAAQGEIERTKGRRFAVLSEPNDNDKINIGYMKELSGNDKILTRGLYKDPYEFTPQFTMILACNDLPEIPSDDGGTWRRIRVIEFSSKFVENPTKPNEFLIDIELAEKLERYAEVFLSMLIERHKNINPLKINEPREVINATQKYKNNNDSIGQFVTEKIIKDDNVKEKLSITEIYSIFRIWSSKNITKNKKQPDRNQVRSYFEKLYGIYDNKGWKLRFNLEDDNDNENEIVN